MLITCPKCNTSYEVPAVIDKPDQKVRCARCGHVWEPAADVIDPLSIDLILSNISAKRKEEPAPAIPDFFAPLPEKKNEDFLKWLKPLYFISLFCIVASVYLFFFHPAKNSPVTLQSISYELEEQDYKTYLVLKAAAFNNTERSIRPQKFTVRFADEENRTLTVTDVESPVDILPPKSIEEVTVKIERPPSKTAKIIMTLTEMETI